MGGHKVLGKSEVRRSVPALMRIALTGVLVCSVSSPVFAAAALPMQSDFLVNEEAVDVEAYMIEGNNYFKLRDLARALQGTEKEFDVAWDGSLNAINLVSGKAYNAAGEESVGGERTKKEAALSTSKVYKDGEMLKMTAYQVGNNNYFKLRDFAKAFDVDLQWLGTAIKISAPIKNAQPVKDENMMIQKDALKLPVKTISQYPVSQEEYENILLYMMDADLETYEVAYDEEMYESIESGQLLETIKVAYTKVFGEYIEQFGSLEGLGMSANGNENRGTIELKMQPIGGYSLAVMKVRFFEGCSKIVNKLIDEGKITSTMTEAETAKVLYEWVVSNVASDPQELEISRTGYGAVTNKKAVCQGYTALYNTLCKLAGIKVEGVVGTAGSARENHSWTLATLDGQKTYIDVTYGALLSEKEGRCDFRYFMASEDFLRNDHYWH